MYAILPFLVMFTTFFKHKCLFLAKKQTFMANSYFKFKQFTISHDKCGMKVGTDGVLLGAWADTEHCKHILDIGTGSGLITLMLAQRSNAIISGIEIDKNAYLQSQENVNNSPWEERIQLFHADFTNWETTQKFDLIVSNPPYFEQSLKGKDKARNTARHTTNLSFEALIKQAKKQLAPKGRIALILPTDTCSTISNIITKNQLYINKITHIKPQPNKDSKRILIQISDVKNEPIRHELTIELARHKYSDEYISLTKDFYLKM
jgi:tRNA1Val (adenine37-N6)-methyltransferase